MKKIISVMLIIAMAFIICSCGENKTSKPFSARKGAYAIGQSATLDVYDITETGEVFFEVSWVGLNGFGGIAKLVSETKASFDITNQENETVTGNLFVVGNNILVEISSCSIEYIDPEKYTFEFSNETDKNYTYIGAYLSSYLGGGDYSHLFEQFVEKYDYSNIKDWEYLGYTEKLFVSPYGRDALSCDFYKAATLDSKIKYYAMSAETLNGFPQIIVYEVSSNKEINKVWENEVLPQNPSKEYLGKTVGYVFEKFGSNYEVHSINGRISFSLKNSPYSFIFTEYLGIEKAAFDSLSVKPQPSDKIYGYYSEKKGTEVFQGVKIGDSVESIKKKVQFNYTSAKVGAESYIDGCHIRWYFTDIENVDPLDPSTYKLGMAEVLLLDVKENSKKTNDGYELANENNLLNKIQGWWGFKSSTYYELLHIFDKKIQFGVAEGELDREGTIRNIVKKQDGSFELTVHYPETYLFEEYYPEYEGKFYISSPDNFQNNMTLIDGVGNKFNYIFAGKEDYHSIYK